MATWITATTFHGYETLICVYAEYTIVKDVVLVYFLMAQSRSEQSCPLLMTVTQIFSWSGMHGLGTW